MSNDFWIVVLSSGITAAIISSLCSIVGNYLYFNWKFKKETEAGYIQARVERYSRLQFFLKVWLLQPIEPSPTTSELDKIDQLISSRLDLISQEIQKDWLRLRELIREGQYSEATLLIKTLIKRVRTEFNNELVPELTKYVGNKIQKLSEQDLLIRTRQDGAKLQ